MFYNKLFGELIRQKNGGRATPEPPAGSFFERAWYTNLDLYTQTSKTPFIQGMRDNSLDPELYTRLFVVDIYYCFRAEASMKLARDRVPAAETALKELYNVLIKGYEDYNQYFIDYWNINTLDGIKPTTNFKNYADAEETIAKTEHPVYTLVAYIPCYYLWYQLGVYLKTNYDNTLYKDWIDGNLDPSPGYEIGNFIEQWIADKKEWDDTKALTLYRNSMTYEKNAFNEAASLI